MADLEMERLYLAAQQALRSGDYGRALSCLERCVAFDPSPQYLSAFGYCLARVRSDYHGGIVACREALRLDPANSFHYLQLGRVYLLAGRKRNAIQTWRQGLSVNKNSSIIRELNRLGERRKPVVTWLARGHPLNRCLGKFMCRIGLR
jgi:tetratricopeptide (TPR) repeat protein